MPVTTPVGWHPAASSTGYRPTDRITFAWSRFAGDGTLTHVRLKIFSDAGGTTLVWDSLWRLVDDIHIGAQYMDVWPEDAGLAKTTNYYWSVAHRNDLMEASSYSPLVLFTTETPAVTDTRIIEAN